MVNEINEDFGLGDRNFHPEEQRIYSEAMPKDKDLEDYSRNDYDPYQDDLDDDDVNENVDEDLDDDDDDSDEDLD